MSDARETLIELSALSKTFSTDELETRALCDVDLVVGQGEYLAITGPSGCGKSTLLSILGLIEVPTAGCYRLAGEDVSQLGLARRANLRNLLIGFVFQDFHLIGDQTVLSNVAMPLLYRGIDRTIRDARAGEVLELVGMTHRANHYPSQLSGGQQQRVAVARAIVGQPKLLLADEPTGNLDSATGDAVMEILAEIHAEGTTICLVTHDPQHAKRSDRHIELLDGKLLTGDRL